MSHYLLHRLCTALLALVLLGSAHAAAALRLDKADNTVTLSDARGTLSLRLNVQNRCVIDQIQVRGRDVLALDSGVYSGVYLGGTWLTTLEGIASPALIAEGASVIVRGIRFGGDTCPVEETWIFTEAENHIIWRIERTYGKAATLDDTCMPRWNFADMQTWTGAILDTGGVAWCKLMGNPNASYGVHGTSATCWNVQSNDCLRILGTAMDGIQGAMQFTHQSDGVFSLNHAATVEPLQTKHELRRFLADRQDIWAPFTITPGKVAIEYILSAPRYSEAYDMGELQGIDGAAVREICNTIGRIGVIDHGIMGSNGWYSGYAVLHEPWFAQMGLAMDDPNYFTNYAATLDDQRDQAIGPDGRVKSRWAYGAFDAIPGTYDANGYYEAQWGMLMDAQPGYVINVAEQFDFTGDVEWVRGHKQSCELALAYLLRRDSNGNGLVECLNESHTDARGSDWIDIVWAAFENGFINAQMYAALALWADIEDVLGDNTAAARYRTAATAIREAFNKPVAEGGLWLPDRGCYAYWRDKDGSVHGVNFVTPVNLMAVAYGLCDDPARKAQILDTLEARMNEENLFFWPLCLDSYAREEVHKNNWPFPNYENGDLFLAWGEVGVRAYAGYSPETALKYVRNVLAKYNTDGLAFQRYQRQSQNGAGDDILANNMQIVTGLFRDIYGVQPKHNRLLLDPRLTPDLDGTRLNYHLRGNTYEIALHQDSARVVSGNFALRAQAPFGVNMARDRFQYFPGTANSPALMVTPSGLDVTEFEIQSWTTTERRWTVLSPGAPVALHYKVAGLKPNARYLVSSDGQEVGPVQADSEGLVTFTLDTSVAKTQIVELRVPAAG